MPLFIFIDIGRVELRHAGPHYSLVSAHSFLEPLLLLFPTPTLQSEYCVDKSVYIQPFALLCPNLKPMNFLPPLLIHFHRNLSSSMEDVVVMWISYTLLALTASLGGWFWHTLMKYNRSRNRHNKKFGTQLFKQVATPPAVPAMPIRAMA